MVDRAAIDARLRRHVDTLAGLIGPRHLGDPASVAATLGYCRQQLGEIGVIAGHETYDALGEVATNLVMVQRGTDQADQIVLLGAHYDTVKQTPGADDNASAVAVLLEVLRLLKGCEHRRTARFVLFACEEPPYFHLDSMGSQHHARQSRLCGDEIVGMLCLESVGYFRQTPGSQRRPPGVPSAISWALPSRGNFLAAVGNLSSKRLCWQFRRGFRSASALPLRSLCLPERINAIRLSDNSSFCDQGYPALMITDTAFLRNPNYHRPTDTPATLDYGAMVEVTLGVAAAMRRLLR